MEQSMGRVGPPATGIIETEVGGRVNIYHPETQEVSLLNETASDVWRLSDGAHTLDQIVEFLASHYGVNREEIRADVSATVETFRANGLIAGDR